MNYKSTLLFSLLLCFGTLTIAQQELTGTIEHDNLTRDYIIYLPVGYAPGTSLPLVFNFHGFGSNALEQRFYAAMNGIADAEGFILCYPNGVDNRWNVDWNFGGTEDDIGFTAALIEEFSDLYNIDRSRVYACGMSNGGFFSYQLACELSDQIAAVASVTGSFSPNMLNTCNPSRKVPVMEIHGTDDLVVAYNGSVGVSIAVEDVVDFWVNHNTCTGNPVIDEYPDTNTGDGSTVTRMRYLDCEEESEVYFLKVNNGGHTWPGATVLIPAANTNLDINGSQEIWDFFSQHQIAELSSVNEALKTIAPEVFPNPTSGLINLSSELAALSYRIYDINGQLILAEQVRQKQIDLSKLNTGVYLLELSDAHQSWVKRVVKN